MEKRLKNDDFYGEETKVDSHKTKSENKKKKIVIAVFIGVLLLFFLVCLNLIFTPNIILKGKNKMTINYQKEYKEPGYTAKYLGKDVTNSVKVTGKINSKKLGQQKIKYEIKKGIFNKTVYRVVNVKDLSAPVITLENGDKVNVCPNEEYKENGFTAIDNYDGDVTKKVKVTKEKTKFVYEVTDKAGNKTKINREIVYSDKEKPTITLNGGNKLFMYINENFDDPGVEVSDNCDKEIKSKIKVSNGINNKQLGTYKVIYYVTDASGNKAEEIREVEVIEPGKNGTVYLTFDDGPREGTTNVILDILKKHNVKATFFVINTGPDSLIKREFDEGHTIALHTASHDYAHIYSSVDNFYNDLKIISDRVERITGYKSMYIRFPGGSSNTISRRYSSGIMSTLTNDVKARGYKYYDWNISSGDAGGVSTADGVFNTVISNLSKDRVNMILFHDIKTYTRDAIERIIIYCKQNGYALDKITDRTEEIHQHVNN